MKISKNVLCTIFLLSSILMMAQTTIEKNGEKWDLLVDGKPFEIKGATFEFVKDVENYDTYFKDLKFLGVNSIRTWATGKETKALLDAAQKYNIKIMMGIWMRHGKPGREDDDQFNYLKDTEGKQDMYNSAIDFVKKHKDHPAVLTWGIGNEVYLNMATDPEKVAYSKLLEKICKEIKKIDPNHPISSVEAWTFGMDWWKKYVPSIDIYGLNSYGAGVSLLQKELEKRTIDKPYIITEFGVQGEWDIKQEVNGVKVEPTDKEKYDAILNGYNNWIVNKPNNLGVYVFHYGNDNNHMSPWLLMLHDGMFRPQYWATREAYTGKKPINFVPTINTFKLSKNEAKSNTWISAKLNVSDVEKDSLVFSFHYNQRTGSRKRRDQLLPLLHKGNIKEGFQIQLPEENGSVKIYVNVKDSYNNIGIASTGIIVKDKKSKKKKYLVPKVSLPFYVYKEGKNSPYAASGFMGSEMKAISVDVNFKKDVHSGKNALKISYNSSSGWYGLSFQDPANDWGDILGGYNISGAKTFSFWAKSTAWDLKATVGFGLIKDDKEFPDTAITSEHIVLSKEWKKYTFKIKRFDLSCIRSGFVIFSGSDGSPHEIYLDDIVFE